MAAPARFTPTIFLGYVSSAQSIVGTKQLEWQAPEQRVQPTTNTHLPLGTIIQWQYQLWCQWWWLGSRLSQHGWCQVIIGCLWCYRGKQGWTISLATFAAQWKLQATMITNARITKTTTITTIKKEKAYIVGSPSDISSNAGFPLASRFVFRYQQRRRPSQPYDHELWGSLILIHGGCVSIHPCVFFAHYVCGDSFSWFFECIIIWLVIHNFIT